LFPPVNEKADKAQLLATVSFNENIVTQTARFFKTPSDTFRHFFARNRAHSFFCPIFGFA